VSLHLWCSIYKSGKIGYMIFQCRFAFYYIWQSLGHVIVFQIIFLLMNFMGCPWIYLVWSSLLTKLHEHYFNAYENFLLHMKIFNHVGVYVKFPLYLWILVAYLSFLFNFCPLLIKCVISWCAWIFLLCVEVHSCWIVFQNYTYEIFGCKWVLLI
jgi:hypothetical protein